MFDIDIVYGDTFGWYYYFDIKRVLVWILIPTHIIGIIISMLNKCENPGCISLNVERNTIFLSHKCAQWDAHRVLPKSYI